MNGKERNLSLFRKLSAYIMQDNQLHANLTVEEAMNVAANLKLSQQVARSEKLSVVRKLWLSDLIYLNRYLKLQQLMALTLKALWFFVLQNV